MLRSILGIRLKDKMSIEDIYSKTGAKKVGVVAKTFKLKYAGHMIRDNESKWNRILTMWNPYEGKRSRGRPKTRWVDEIKRDMGNVWMRMVKDRQKWKDLVSTYAQKWAAEGVDSSG